MVPPRLAISCAHRHHFFTRLFNVRERNAQHSLRKALAPSWLVAVVDAHEYVETIVDGFQLLASEAIARNALISQEFARSPRRAETSDQNAESRQEGDRGRFLLPEVLSGGRSGERASESASTDRDHHLTPRRIMGIVRLATSCSARPTATWLQIGGRE
jgi:hypothetical protein